MVEYEFLIHMLNIYSVYLKGHELKGHGIANKIELTLKKNQSCSELSFVLF